MTNKIIYTLIVWAMLTSASAQEAVSVKPILSQDQNQYDRDAGALKYTQDRINELTQRVREEEEPFEKKYEALDATLEKLDKPYTDQIKTLSAQVAQANQPYRDQIKQRDEEQKRIEFQTRPYREQIKHLDEESRNEHKVVEEDARKLASDRQAYRAQPVGQAQQYNAQAHPIVAKPQQPIKRVVPTTNRPIVYNAPAVKKVIPVKKPVAPIAGPGQ
jgi:chromosome segregation ATPase